MSDSLVTYRGTVYPWQCDHNGHMNVMFYVGKFDEASWQLLSRLGLSRSYIRKAGATLVAVEQHLQYNHELHAGDVVTIRSELVEVRDKSIHFIHRMTNDETGGVAATSALVGVHIDTTSRKGRSLPAAVRERAALLCDAEQHAHGKLDSISLETLDGVLVSAG